MPFDRLAARWPLVALAVALGGCDESPSTPITSPPVVSTVTPVESIRPQVAAFCGDCHGIPQPGTFPKNAWRHEVERGFGFYSKSGRSDLVVPRVEEVVRFYETLAPERLVVEPPASATTGEGGPLRFRRASISSPLAQPAVSFLRWMRLPQEREMRLLVSDMRDGIVGAARLSAAGGELETLTVLLNPSRVWPSDLDGDGKEELVIGELGSFSSADHHRGAVVWLRREEAGGWQQTLLIGGLGRVADVRPGDFNGDGRQDLVVAEFGHLQTGRVLLYENQGVEQGKPKLVQRVIDDRHGAIDVPVADLNGDGRLDFLALISQEYEVVEAYLNSGEGRFDRQTVFAAGDPSIGSSGIELVDLDKDADLDVLYSNGDTFGSDSLKSYHGVRWLENRGSFPFVEHHLTGLVGVQAACTADLDGDGDLDVAAAAFMPTNLVTMPELAQHDSLIWLEQKEPGKFVRHSLETGKFMHAALTADDFDGDGDVDLAVGCFQDAKGASEPAVTIWWNTSK